MKTKTNLLQIVILILLILMLVFGAYFTLTNYQRKYQAYFHSTGILQLKFPFTWRVVEDRSNLIVLVKSPLLSRKIEGVIVLTYGNNCQEEIKNYADAHANWSDLVQKYEEVNGFAITDISEYSIKEKKLYSYSYYIPIEEIRETITGMYAEDMLPALKSNDPVQVNIIENVVNTSYIEAEFLTSLADMKTYLEAKEIIESIEIEIKPCLSQQD